MAWEFKMVDPPAEVPVDEKARSLGLVDGLRAEESESSYRCDPCNQMQPPGSVIVWVPRGVMRWDPEWSVKEAGRLAAHNGHWSGWCLKCARGLGSKGPKSWIRRWLIP